MKLRTALLGGLGSILIAALAAQAQVPGVNSTLASVFTLAYDNSTSKPTYSATGVVTPTGSPTDVCSITGSATKTIRVRRVIVSGTNSAAISEAVAIVKRSTANSAGAGSAMTQVSYSSANTAGTVAVAEVWTGTPTLGTVVGRIADVYVLFGTSTSLAPATVFEFGQLGSPVFLRGAAQQLSVNLEGQGGGAGTIICTFEWTEDTDS